ncbi:MAG: hypothetical protein DBX46_05010 [Clostridiales bacterium]|nr:MAG: hypothetical protein DBX46_05010 [Clostridiales bacterium]
MDRIKAKHDKGKKRMNWFLIAVGGLLILETCFAMCISNYNLGVIMPAVIGAPLLIYGLFFGAVNVWFETSLGNAVKIVFMFCYGLLALLIVICTAAIEAGANGRADKNCDAIIVLGAAVHGNRPSRVLQSRLDTAYQYWENNRDCVIVVSGGKGKEELVTEASAMRRYLLDRGVPEESVLEEERATSTLENFKFSKLLLEEHFPNGYSAVFTTSHYHVYRARLAARQAGLDIEGVSAPFSYWLTLNYYLRETAALARYWLFGMV